MTITPQDMVRYGMENYYETAKLNIAAGEPVQAADVLKLYIDDLRADDTWERIERIHCGGNFLANWVALEKALREQDRDMIPTIQERLEAYAAQTRLPQKPD